MSICISDIFVLSLGIGLPSRLIYNKYNTNIRIIHQPNTLDHTASFFSFFNHNLMRKIVIFIVDVYAFVTNCLAFRDPTVKLSVICNKSLDHNIGNE